MCFIVSELVLNNIMQEVASMFAGGPPYLSLQYGLNNSWYVTFESEEATQRAFLHLQNLGKTFNNKPICVSLTSVAFFTTVEYKNKTDSKVLFFFFFLYEHSDSRILQQNLDVTKF